MVAVTFDTLQASKELQEKGFDQEQAEAIAQVVRNGQSDFATKSDIESIRSEIDSIRSELSIIRWMMGIHIIVMLGGFSLLAVLG